MITNVIVVSVTIALLGVMGGAVACNQADNLTRQKFIEYGYLQKCETPAGTTTCNMVWVK